MSSQNAPNSFILNQQIPSRLLVIDSDYKVSGTNTNFTTPSFNIACKFLALKYINFVNNIYMINPKTNYIVIDNVQYNLTNGNYSAQQLVTMLNAIVGMPLTWSYNSITNKFSWNGPNPNYTITWDTVNIRLAIMMGLVVSGTNVFSYTLAPPYTGIRQANLNYSGYVDVICDEISKYGSSSFGTNTQQGLIARIPLQQYALNASVLYEDKTNNFIAFNNNQIGALSFRMIDEWGDEFALDDNCNVSIVFDISI